jgi:hypothetical protein
MYDLERMQVARWYYVKEPIYPPENSQFHHPSMYQEILRVVKENHGLTGREITERVGKKHEYVTSLLWRLRKYTGAVRSEVVGYVVTPGLEEFARTPCVVRMLSKLGSEKTKGPWLHRIFRYDSG